MRIWIPDSDIFEEAEEAAMERNASFISVDLKSYRPTNERVEVLAKHWHIPVDRVEQTLGKPHEIWRSVSVGLRHFQNVVKKRTFYVSLLNEGINIIFENHSNE